MPETPLPVMIQRWEQMIELQKKIAPFTPTIREIDEVWGFHSTSHVRAVLLKLHEMGLVKVRVSGRDMRYYAIHPNPMYYGVDFAMPVNQKNSQDNSNE